MSSIGFVSFPETGHLNASFKLARTLQGRGHRVFYIGLRDFEDSIRRQGFEYLPVLEDLCPRGFVQKHAVATGADNFDAVLDHAMRSGGVLNLPRELLGIKELMRPDLFIIDLLLTDIAVIANRIGVPMAILNTQLFDPWAEDPGSYDYLLDKTELILCPEEFDFPGTKRKPESYYVEAAVDLRREDAPFPWERIDESKPLVYASFGSQSHLIDGSRPFFEAIIQVAAARPDLQFVLTVGSFEPEGFGTPPPNLCLVRTAPQLQILKKATVMITHGGFNSVKECIYFDVPMIFFPVIRDHPAIAARAAYHGLGVVGDLRESTAEQIEGLLDRILMNPQFKERVMKLGSIFRMVEEASPGADVIERLLHQRSAAHR
jgi:UDP:flavonoid glycosyltransferase YjiC (YdhE family)